MGEPHGDATSYDPTARPHTDDNAVNSTAGPIPEDHIGGDGRENPIDEMDGEEHECLPVPDEILEMILNNLMPTRCRLPASARDGGACFGPPTRPHTDPCPHARGRWQREAIWRPCDGRAPMGARGTKQLDHLQLETDTLA
nr:hypothetical protein [Pandoravirus massiliensis]